MAKRVTLTDINGNEILPKTTGDQVKTQNNTSNIETDISLYGLHTGMIVPYTASTPPAGWLKCDGSAISRTTYSALFSIISTVYGSGDGSTTFNIPNLLDRIPIGYSSTYSLGTTGGSKDAVMVSHNHTITQNVGGSFKYNENGTLYGNGYGGRPGSTDGNLYLTEDGNDAIGNWANSGNSQRGRDVYAKYNIPNIVIQSEGESGTNKNLQPYQAVNYIIKY